MTVKIQQFMYDMGIDSYEDIGFLYQDYIFECNEITTEINQLITSSSIETIEKRIHNLKGVSANLYVTSVYEQAKVVDALLTAHINEPQVTPEILEAWQILLDLYKEASLEIVSFFSRNSVMLKTSAQ